MKLATLAASALAHACVAILIGEVGLGLAVLAKNGMDEDKLLQLLAVTRDIDLYTMWAKLESDSRPIKKAQVSHEDVMDRRRELSMDLDLREIAAEKGLRDIHGLSVMLGREREQYIRLRDEFDTRLANIQKGAADQQLLDMQRKLQALQPRQSKDQILRFLDDKNNQYEQSLQIVVTIIKAMPLEKRKKVLAEFKSEEDNRRLHEILRQIRLGVPNVELIRETREQLRQFKDRQ